MTYLILAHFLIGLVVTLRILLRDNMKPTDRLAWFVVILVLPLIGSAIYFLFGEADLGNTENKRHAQVFSALKSSFSSDTAAFTPAYDLTDPAYLPAFQYNASINGFPPTQGNTAELMQNAQTSIDRIIADIDAAKDHVHVSYYIWLDDTTGTGLADALIRAAKRGVTCRAMADGLGSRALIGSDLWTKMKNGGVQLAVSFALDNPLRTLLTSRIDLRNHRKITIIDGLITYCGSRNSADPEFLIKAKFAPWVDILLRFQGPVVAQNEVLFLTDWMQATGEDLDNFPLPATPIPGGFPAAVMGDGPTERNGATPQLFATLVALARDELTISTPYFVPDETVLEALCATALRGVRVTLIFPRVNDNWIVDAASRSYYRKLLTTGCEIQEYKGGLLHAKTLTMDGKITFVGSTNLDLRSFDLNYENNILLQDPEVTKAIRDRQADYLSSSEAVLLSEVEAWPLHRRIWNNVIATIGPVL